MGKIKTNLVGKRFGRLLVTRPVTKKEHGKEFRWECKCDCGKLVLIRRTSLVDGITKSCGCLKKERFGAKFQNWKGCGCISGGFIYRYISHAKRRKIKFDLTKEYMYDLLLEQKAKCSLTGKELWFNKQKTNASLDRIDSSKGYVEGNVQWVLKEVNFAKQKLSQKEFIALCGDVVEWNREKKES